MTAWLFAMFAGTPGPRPYARRRVARAREGCSPANVANISRTMAANIANNHDE